MRSADALVLFGVTGDLALRKILPALFAMVAHGRLVVPVIGVAREGWSRERLVERAREAVAADGPVDERVLGSLAQLLHYVPGDYADRAMYGRLRAALGGARTPVHYLAIPPSLFPTVVEGLGAAGCADGARVVLEKPFGRSLASAQALSRTLHAVFAEDAILRIDHYLGKETVQNILYFRFGNSFLEPIWNRNYVDRVEVTMAESFGVGSRGKFYEEAGAVRDVVQNHLLQVVSLLAMEPPVGQALEGFRDEKVRVLKSIRPPSREDVVLGQYRGYRDEPGVGAQSTVETFAALRLFLDSWRWQDVPFYLRAGKRLPVTATEVLATLRPPPQRRFSGRDLGSERPNHLRFRMGPEFEIALGATVLASGRPRKSTQVELFACRDPAEQVEPYELLLAAALEGDPLPFARQDEVEAAWRVVDPILAGHDPPETYEPGSWGPARAERLLDPAGDWHDPRGSA